MVGVGGMAIVHRSIERGPDGFEREVALKRPLPHLAEDSGFLAAFVHEAKLASLLRHPNIVEQYELGRVGPSCFISMEYVWGRDVRAIVQQARRVGCRPPVEIVVALLTELLQALDYAHTRCGPDGAPLGIVHRDISPSNLVVSRSGRLVVIDFGVARASHSLLHRNTGRIKGKLSYMAPETLTGGLDGRSDLFSASVTAHEMLTLLPLFGSGDDPQTIERVRTMRPPPPSADNRSCPPELDEILLRGLAKDPADRWPSAAEMLDAVTQLEATGLRRANRTEVQRWVASVFAMELAELPAPVDDELTVFEPPYVRVLQEFSFERRSFRTMRRAGVAALAQLLADARTRCARLARSVRSSPRSLWMRPRGRLAMLAATGAMAGAGAGAILIAASAPDAGQVAIGQPRPGAETQGAAPATATDRVTPDDTASGTGDRIASAEPVAHAARAPLAEQHTVGTRLDRLEREPAARSTRARGPTARRSAPPGATSGRAGPGPGALISLDDDSAAKPDGTPSSPRNEAFEGNRPLSPTAPTASPGETIELAPILVPLGPMQRESGDLPRIRLPAGESSPGQLTARLCIDRQGGVTSVATVSTVSRAVGGPLERALKRWRYRPLMGENGAVPACFARSFRVRVL